MGINEDREREKEGKGAREGKKRNKGKEKIERDRGRAHKIMDWEARGTLKIWFNSIVICPYLYLCMTVCM